MPIAVVARAVGMFAIGTTEFGIVGLLPTIAGHLHVSSRDRRSHPDRPSDLRNRRPPSTFIAGPPGPRHLHDGTASRSTWPLAALRGARGRYQAFVLLRIAFTVAPIAFGRAKFFNVRVTGRTTSPRGSTTSRPGRARTSCTSSAASRCWPACSRHDHFVDVVAGARVHVHGVVAQRTHVVQICARICERGLTRRSPARAPGG
jgi:hypothetical protein